MSAELSDVFTLDELINEGLITLGRGKVISRKDLAATPGTYPVYSSAKENEGKFGEYGLYMFDEELITWSIDGGGRFFHRKQHKFSVTNIGGTLRINDTNRLGYKFLYYCLTLLHSKIDFDWVKKAHPSIIRKLFNKIPIPPLDEQKRIVSILDEAFEDISRMFFNSENRIISIEELIESKLQLVFHQESLDWEIIPFEESIVKVKSSSKIKKRDFLETGSYPIISQEADYINGYWENESDLLTIESPVVAFGDHTKTLKYIDFDFVRGADGLKVLQPREFILPKFFYHYLRSIQLETLGYARHYRLLKQVEIRFPGMDEQHQIASMFDELDKQAFQAKELDEQELHSLDELKRSLLQEAFSGKLTGGIAA